MTDAYLVSTNNGVINLVPGSVNLPSIRIKGYAPDIYAFVNSINSFLSYAPVRDLLSDVKGKGVGVDIHLVNNPKTSIGGSVWKYPKNANGDLVNDPTDRYDIKMDINLGRKPGYKTATDMSAEKLMTFVHELMHPLYGSHNFADKLPINVTPQLVSQDTITQKEASIAASLRLGIFYSGSIPFPGVDPIIVSSKGYENYTGNYGTPYTYGGVTYKTVTRSDGRTVYIVPDPVFKSVWYESTAYAVEWAKRRDEYPGHHNGFGPAVVDGDADGINGAASKAWNYVKHQQRAGIYGVIGGIAGTALGNSLAKGNLLKGVLYSSVLGEIGERIGAALAGPSPMPTEATVQTSIGGGVAEFSSDVWNRMQSAAIGTVSTFLSLELGEALGLEGFGAELTGAASTAVFNKILTNVTTPGAQIFDGFSFKALGDGVGSEFWAQGGAGSAMAASIGSFLGAKLGSLVVQPETQAAAILSSIGSGVGTWAFSSVGLGIGSGLAANSWMLGNLVLPGIGAFIGFVLGALIGNLFGKKNKPKVPTASAETFLEVPYARYEFGHVTSANGGSSSFVRSMATAARDTLNGLIGYVAYTDTATYVSNLNGASTDQRYGHTGSQIYVKINGVQHNFSSADKAVEYGTLTAIKNTKVIGGNLFIKRAIFRSGATDLTTLLGDIQVAKDYEAYSYDRQLIDGYFVQAYASLSQTDKAYYETNKALIDKAVLESGQNLSSSELAIYNGNTEQFERVADAVRAQSQANAWIISLQRIHEVGLDKWSSSDFYGGLRGFLASFDPDNRGLSFENFQMSPAGGGYAVSYTGDSDGLFSFMATASATGRAVTINNLADIGYTAGSVTYGSDLYDGSTGSAMNHVDYFGDDIITGSSYADIVQAGAGWDWVRGGGGDDTIAGGDGHDVIIGESGNDILMGDAGDDYIATGDGGSGFDGGYGGAGDDIILDGSGSDYLHGDDGNDILVLADDGSFNWYLGGSGSDTVSAERLGFGVYLHLDYRPPEWNGHADPYAADPSSLSLGVVNADNFSNWHTTAGLVGVENLTGSQFKDLLVGNSGANVVRGLAGNDELQGLDGDDVLEGGAEADTLHGGSGLDFASYEKSSGGVSVSLATGVAIGSDADGDELDSIENLRGSKFADQLTGNDGANRLEGLSNDDWFVATRGADTITGGAGSDTVDYSQGGFSPSVVTTTVWVDGYTIPGWDNGYWDYMYEYNPVWVTVWVPEEYVPGHWQTTTVSKQALTYAFGVVTVVGADGAVFQQTATEVEKIIGTDHDDTISAFLEGGVIVGGKGNDVLASGWGADTYVFRRGDGLDSVSDYDRGDVTNAESNTILLAGDIRWSELVFNVVASPYSWVGADLEVSIAGDTSSKITLKAFFKTGWTSATGYFQANNFATLDNDGGGQLDMSELTYVRLGTASSEALYGSSSQSDLIVASNGDDYIDAAGQSWEMLGNVVIAGLGNDNIVTSAGDDQFAYDAGDGVDIITDSGGADTIVFGPTVAAEDVIYQVVGYDLYIGVRDKLNPTWSASQVVSRIRVVNGGVITRELDYWSGQVSYEVLNTIEYVIAGGASIDLTKLDINWAVNQYTGGYYDPNDPYGYGYPYGYPIALDLDGDGLNLSAVKDSDVALRLSDGSVARIGWVGPTDGLLAVDRNGDGKIDRLSEVSFTQDKPGSKSDLEGLQTWDANGDGKLDANDDGFSKILVWVDANQNGRSTQKELRTLSEAGISAINLAGIATGMTRDMTIDSFVQNKITFDYADGSKGDGFDVALAMKKIEGLTPDAGSAGELGRVDADKRGNLFLDTSDTDKVAAGVLERWKKKDQADHMEGEENLERLRAVSLAKARMITLYEGAKAENELVQAGLDQAQATVSAPASSGQPNRQVERPGGQQTSGGLVGLARAGGSEASYDAVEPQGSRSGASGDWWTAASGFGGSLQAQSLGQRLAAMDGGRLTAPLPVAGEEDGSLLAQQAQLRQAMASFGGESGGQAAIWSRSNGNEAMPLAASSGLFGGQGAVRSASAVAA